MLGKDILRRKKKLVYNVKDQSEDTVNASSFNCVVPLKYFEKLDWLVVTKADVEKKICFLHYYLERSK